MLDHVTITVRDIEGSKQFYDQALRPLGIKRLYAEGTAFAGYGIGKKAFFWIGERDAPQTSIHIAFSCPDRATVDAFHAAAMKAGGNDNGQPGLRPRYHPNYYDGHNIEAVCPILVE